MEKDNSSRNASSNKLRYKIVWFILLSFIIGGALFSCLPKLIKEQIEPFEQERTLVVEEHTSEKKVSIERVGEGPRVEKKKAIKTEDNSSDALQRIPSVMDQEKKSSLLESPIENICDSFSEVENKKVCKAFNNKGRYVFTLIIVFATGVFLILLYISLLVHLFHAIIDRFGKIFS